MSTPNTNANNDSPEALLGRVNSFLKKALEALEPWKHHPAAADAAAHIAEAQTHIAQGVVAQPAASTAAAEAQNGTGAPAETTGTAATEGDGAAQGAAQQ